MGRVDQFIKDYKPQVYWYRPEFEGPAAILKTASTDLSFIYRQFSGAVHGGFLGSALFEEIPNFADINPQNYPRRSRLAAVMSSRILLEISYLRDHFEGTKLDATYKSIMKDLYLPLKANITPPAEIRPNA